MGYLAISFFLRSIFFLNFLFTLLNNLFEMIQIKVNETFFLHYLLDLSFCDTLTHGF